MKNYAIDRVLSRDMYYPPFETLATMPTLTSLSVLPIAAGDLLSSLNGCQSGQSRLFCVDLRSDEEVVSGSLPAMLRVEAKVWKNAILLEGVLKCLSEIRDHGVCIVTRGHPDHREEEWNSVNDCVK